ncbi:DUF4296 domain-containing protein [Flavobacterium sp. CYK-4]|uniref:DUF4296 domain-containing protein n=1 Tax=Flavobacterium lotistagni TaxID=2709660 RepID=UPI00140C51C6|nr:DUF4296 domain-containing protein [Flavobacterium lotistagni]NHM06674.1 DUF4296 domain-containing protein [Flavobacterium lotistagni]
MKKIILVLVPMLLLVGCNHNAVEKPSNLIDQETMVNILYDLSILEAIKAQNPYAPQNQNIQPKEYIFKKYKIDSVQFALSNRYYISQIEQYRKMYDEVAQRIETEKKQAEFKAPSANKANNQEAGQVQ